MARFGNPVPKPPDRLINRTTGSASIVPELVYPDVAQAVDWLCGTFGFTEAWRAAAIAPGLPSATAW
jgi:hypothetical protein